jgi:predicted DNA binding CopG/RHH family protein
MTAFHDPYDEMTDTEFAEHVQSLFERDRQISITMRIPESLLSDIRAIAKAARMPYQRLMKGMLASSVQRMPKPPTAQRRRPATPKVGGPKTKPRVKA